MATPRYTPKKIAEKTGLTTAYVQEVLTLLQHGEERLLIAVEKGTIPLTAALAIVGAGDDDKAIQAALQEAYESGKLPHSLFQDRQQAGIPPVGRGDLYRRFVPGRPQSSGKQAAETRATDQGLAASKIAGEHAHSGQGERFGCVLRGKAMSLDTLASNRPRSLQDLLARMEGRAAKLATADRKEDQPVQLFLPGLEEFMRAMPNHLARSSLFAPVARGRKKMHMDVVLVSRADAVIKFSGEQLDEAQADVWMQAMHEAGRAALGEPVLKPELEAIAEAQEPA